jgi:predicted  nucleic acid-binding Zn-ribbon protein
MEMNGIAKVLDRLEELLKKDIKNVDQVQEDLSALNINLTDLQSGKLEGRRTIASEYLEIIEHTRKELHLGEIEQYKDQKGTGD